MKTYKKEIWAVISSNGSDEFVREFGSKEEAVRYAEQEWDHLTASEKKKRIIRVGVLTEDMMLRDEVPLMEDMAEKELKKEIERMTDDQFPTPEYYFGPEEMGKDIEPRFHQPEGTRIIGYDIMDPEEYCQARKMEDPGNTEDDSLVIWIAPAE